MRKAYGVFFQLFFRYLLILAEKLIQIIIPQLLSISTNQLFRINMLLKKHIHLIVQPLIYIIIPADVRISILSKTLNQAFQRIIIFPGHIPGKAETNNTTDKKSGH